MKIKKKLIDNITDQTCKFAKFLNDNNIAHILVIDKGNAHFCQAANGGELIPLMLASVIKNVCDVTNLTPENFLDCLKLFLYDKTADPSSYFKELPAKTPFDDSLMDLVTKTSNTLSAAKVKHSIIIEKNPDLAALHFGSVESVANHIISALVNFINDATKPLEPAEAKFIKSQVTKLLSLAFDLQN